VGRKSAITIAEEDGKSFSGAVGASKVDVAVLVEISRQGRAGFLLYRHRLPCREIARAISEINVQLRAEIVPHSAFGGPWKGDIHVAIFVKIAERNFTPDGAQSKIDRLLQRKVTSPVAEVAGNEETSYIVRARSRQNEVKITVLVQIGDLDVIALRVGDHVLPDSEAAEAIAEEDLQVGSVIKVVFIVSDCDVDLPILVEVSSIYGNNIGVSFQLERTSGKVAPAQPKVNEEDAFGRPGGQNVESAILVQIGQAESIWFSVATKHIGELEVASAIAIVDLYVVAPLGDRYDVKFAVSVEVSAHHVLRKGVFRDVPLEREVPLTVSSQDGEVIEARQVNGEIDVPITIEITTGHDLGQWLIATPMVGQSAIGKGGTKRAPYEAEKSRYLIFHSLDAFIEKSRSGRFEDGLSNRYLRLGKARQPQASRSYFR
jgi:hypothetical protein